MVTSYTQATQNNNKCPHGFPIGSCPLCSGMGGVPKDRNKARKSGEMSYNECMAAWIKIQAAKEAKIQAQIDKIEANQQKLIELKMQMAIDKMQKSFEKYLQKLDNLPSIISIPAKIILNVVIKPILNIISQIPKAINVIHTFFVNVTKFILSIAEKLPMVLGEIKNFFDNQIIQKAKSAIKTIISLFSEKQEQEDDENNEKLKLKKIKKTLKSIFRIKNKNEKEQLEDENQLI